MLRGEPEAGYNRAAAGYGRGGAGSSFGRSLGQPADDAVLEHHHQHKQRCGDRYSSGHGAELIGGRCFAVEKLAMAGIMV